MCTLEKVVLYAILFDVKKLKFLLTEQINIPNWGGSLEKEMATHSSILAGKSHGQRSLAGYSPWGCKELDSTEAT